MSEIKVNKISQRSGTAITLGNSGTDFQLPSGADIVAQSGSTITIASGATITNNGTSTGFGPTGAVTWDTTAKTSGFTAVSGTGYFCNTTSASFTVSLINLPSITSQTQSYIVTIVFNAVSSTSYCNTITLSNTSTPGGTVTLRYNGGATAIPTIAPGNTVTQQFAITNYGGTQLVLTSISAFS